MDKKAREELRQRYIEWEDGFFKERERLIGEWIRSDPELVREIREAVAAADRGEGVPAREVFERWPKERTKPT